jgi:hypothetical protein
LVWLTGIGMPCRVSVLLCRLEQSRGGEKREGGREKRVGIQIKFSQNFEHKLEKL